MKVKAKCVGPRLNVGVCGREVYAKGLCRSHCDQLRKGGPSSLKPLRELGADRTHQVSMRFTKPEVKLLIAAAKREGVSVYEFCRAIVRGDARVFK